MCNHHPLLCFCIDVGIKEHDNEGRLITAEFQKYFVVTSCKLKCIYRNLRKLVICSILKQLISFRCSKFRKGTSSVCILAYHSNVLLDLIMQS